MIYLQIAGIIVFVVGMFSIAARLLWWAMDLDLDFHLFSESDD